MEEPKRMSGTRSGDTSIERIAARMRKELEETRFRFGAPTPADSDGNTAVPGAGPTVALTWWLVVESGGKPFQVKLTKPVIVIGRHPACDLRIPGDYVSRFHCKLTARGNRLHMEDLQSRNGTFHNGRRVLETDVSSGEQITIGPVMFRAFCVLQGNTLPGTKSEQTEDGDDTAFGTEAIQP